MPPRSPAHPDHAQTKTSTSSAFKVFQRALTLALVAASSTSYADTLTLTNTWTGQGTFDFQTPQPIELGISVFPLTDLYGPFVHRRFSFEVMRLFTSGELGRADYNSINAFGTLDMARYYRGQRVLDLIPVASTPYFSRQSRGDGGIEAPLPMKTLEAQYGVTATEASALPIDAIRLWSNTVVNGECISVACYTAAAGTLAGRYIVRVNEAITYNLDEQRAISKLKLWLKNNFSLDAFKAKLIRDVNEENSRHIQSLIKQGLTLPSRSAGGIRGSIEFSGTTVFTASPGILDFDITLSATDDLLSVPLAFTRNIAGSFVDIAFDGQTLLRVNGDDHVLDELNVFDLDVASLKGRSGSLTFTINTTGAERAEFFVPESIVDGNYGVSTQISAVPEPETYALLLAGLCVVGATVRRRKAARPTVQACFS